jgi:hypothetical protein
MLNVDVLRLMHGTPLASVDIYWMKWGSFECLIYVYNYLFVTVPEIIVWLLFLYFRWSTCKYAIIYIDILNGCSG